MVEDHKIYDLRHSSPGDVVRWHLGRGEHDVVYGRHNMDIVHILTQGAKRPDMIETIGLADRWDG